MTRCCIDSLNPPNTPLATSGNCSSVAGSARAFRAHGSAGTTPAPRAGSRHSRLKLELIYREPMPTRARARQAIFEFIEVFYNRRRLHSSLGYVTPVEYETQRAEKPTPAQAA